MYSFDCWRGKKNIKVEGGKMKKKRVEEKKVHIRVLLTKETKQIYNIHSDFNH